MLLVMMMMMAVDRKQQQYRLMNSTRTTNDNSNPILNHRDSTTASTNTIAIGKSSNSSSETVIARIESPNGSPRESIGKASNSLNNSSEDDRLAASVNGQTSGSDSLLNSTSAIGAEKMLLQNGQPSLEPTGDDCSATDSIYGSVQASDKTGGKQQRSSSSSKLKNFLMLANHLNPFHVSNSHSGGANQSQTPKGRKNSLDDTSMMKTTLGKQQNGSTTGGCDPSYQKQKSLLNLLNLAQRYFTGASTRQSCDINGDGNHLKTNCFSKSAPVTPVKWQTLDGGAGGERPVSKANGADDLSVENSTTDKLSTARNNPRGSQHQRPSVRFIESDSCKLKRGTNKFFAECGVQTSEDGSGAKLNCLEHEGPDDDLTVEERSAALVRQLFKVTEHPVEAQGETPMDSDKFKDYGYKLIDYISNYLDTIRDRRVTPLNIEPGYLKSLIQADAPEKGESFANIMQDFENHIMCGITHWQHPHFHAYFPAGNAYPSILADMLSDALGCVGFSWAASPAYTELEIIMLDWMGKMIGLPDEFLCLSGGRGGQESKGGGVIQGSASDCVLVNLLAARHWAIEKLRKKYPGTPDGMLLSKLIGYCSKEAHSCVEKAAMIGFIRMRTLETDEKHSLRGETLARAIAMDMANGLEPFIVCATLGTTSCVSFDNLDELGKVCKEHDVWLHVDAAYAGSALICPEFKHLMKGIENATSFNINPNKWMLINFDCSLMWVKDRFKLTRAFVVDPLYLQHSFSDQAIDYRHWGIPLSRRFRALKLWFVIRNYGVEGLRAYIRNHVKLAKLFEQCIRQDTRFTITNEVVLGLVCFRLVGSNALNQRLLSMINASGKLHMVPASLNGRYVIRFCVCDQNAQEADILYAYKCISEFATELFESIRAGKERIRAISQQNTIDVSSISLHTQQSASADRLNNALANEQQSENDQPSADGQLGQPDGQRQQVIGGAGAGQQPSQRDAARQYMWQRHSRSNHATNTTSSSNASEPRPISTPAGNASSLTSSRSPLTKQVSVQPNPQQANQTDENYNNSGSDNAHDDEDLEQEIILDSLATMDGCDYDLDDDDLLEPPFYDEHAASGEPGLKSNVASPQAGPPLGQAMGPMSMDQTDSRSPVARRWHSRAGRASRNQTTACGTGGEHDEAEDEVFTLAERRNRMSLRYKREFFVRVVSDPRVYRASISGDINAHASCCSLGGNASGNNAANNHQQRQNQPNQNTTTSAPQNDTNGEVSFKD